MTVIQIEKTATTFFLPVTSLMAVANAVSTDPHRPQISGICVDHHNGRIQLIATDGAMLLCAVIDGAAFIGESVFYGDAKVGEPRSFVFTTDWAAKAFKRSRGLPKSADLWVYGDTATGLLQTIDASRFDRSRHGAKRLGVVEFESIPVPFPAWRNVIPTESDSAMVPIVVDPAIVAKMAKAAKALTPDKTPVVAMSAATKSGPISVTFPHTDSLTGVAISDRVSRA